MTESAEQRTHRLNESRGKNGVKANEFGPVLRGEATLGRPLSTTPNPLTMPDFDEDFTEVARFDIDGIEVVVSSMEATVEGADKPEFEYLVHGDPLVAEFESDQVLTKAALKKLATSAYNEARIASLKSRLGVVPELDAALKTEMDRIGRSQTTFHAPAGWNGEYALTPVKDSVGNRLDGEECGARASYAEVGESGITYGYQMPGSLINDILVGVRTAGETDDAYMGRVAEASGTDTWSIAEKFFADEFGATLIDDGDLDVAAEFFVKYGPGGVKRACVEGMGERAEAETKLLELSNSWSYGGTVQSDLAAKLGYRYERVDTADGSFAGRYVKADEPALAAHQ